MLRILNQKHGHFLFDFKTFRLEISWMERVLTNLYLVPAVPGTGDHQTDQQEESSEAAENNSDNIVD